MKKILRGRRAVGVAASVLGVWLVSATPALAQGGFDILTLRGPGSSIGVEISELDAEKAKSSSVENGVVVNSVQPDTPASRAGFQPGDIMVEFDGETVRSVRQFRRLVEETRPGHVVKATVVRDRARRALTVTPEPATAANIQAPRSNLPALRSLTVPAQPKVEPNAKVAPFRFSQGITFTSRGRLGVSVMPLETQLADYFGAKQGVLVTDVGSDTPASRAGIKAGDVILEVAAQPVTSPADVNNALRATSAGASVDIKVLRDKKELLLKATMPAAPSPAPERQRF
jgi:serine protease Do